jgi:hypothetical protein
VITDVLGQTVQTIPLNAVEGNNFVQVDLGGLSSGMYFVQVNCGGISSAAKRLVVE